MEAVQSAISVAGAGPGHMATSETCLVQILAVFGKRRLGSIASPGVKDLTQRRVSNSTHLPIRPQKCHDYLEFLRKHTMVCLPPLPCAWQQ